MKRLLRVSKLTKKFGGLTACYEVNLDVPAGQIIGLIGPNGAGKTTIFNCITGMYSPDSGRVVFDEIDITGWTAQKICCSGIARTFQVVKPFRSMTVLENVMIGALSKSADTKKAERRAWDILNFTKLEDKASLLPKALTIADLKRLELSRALASQPKLLMLDEAMAGLTPKECEDAVELIMKIKERGITILMVEHVMEVIMPVSDEIVVIDNGQNLFTGVPEEVANNDQVIKAYLGGD